MTEENNEDLTKEKDEMKVEDERLGRKEGKKECGVGTGVGCRNDGHILACQIKTPAHTRLNWANTADGPDDYFRPDKTNLLWCEHTANDEP